MGVYFSCLEPGDTKATYGTGVFVLAHAGDERPAPAGGFESLFQPEGAAAAADVASAEMTQQPARALIRREPVTCAADRPLREVAALMAHILPFDLFETRRLVGAGARRAVPRSPKRTSGTRWRHQVAASISSSEACRGGLMSPAVCPLSAPSANHRIDPMTEIDNNDGATPNQPVPGA
jgi:hypothetical protein